MQIWLAEARDMHVKTFQTGYLKPSAKTWTFILGRVGVKIPYGLIVEPNMLENPYKLLISQVRRKVQVFALSEVANANMACSILGYVCKAFPNRISHA